VAPDIDKHARLTDCSIWTLKWSVMVRTICRNTNSKAKTIILTEKWLKRRSHKFVYYIRILKTLKTSVKSAFLVSGLWKEAFNSKRNFMELMLNIDEIKIKLYSVQCSAVDAVTHEVTAATTVTLWAVFHASWNMNSFNQRQYINTAYISDSQSFTCIIVTITCLPPSSTAFQLLIGGQIMASPTYHEGRP